MCSRDRTDIVPSRLIRIQHTDGRLVARLCPEEELCTRPQWLTLSHCWGSQPIFTLREANIEQMTSSLPIDSLPKVFQDAMNITVELGYEYLWIDSLCIIQDSSGSRDWMKECEIMDQIYGNAVCNLAATGFHDGHEGLLTTFTTMPPVYAQIEEQPDSERGYQSRQGLGRGKFVHSSRVIAFR